MLCAGGREKAGASLGPSHHISADVRVHNLLMEVFDDGQEKMKMRSQARRWWQAGQERFVQPSTVGWLVLLQAVHVETDRLRGRVGPLRRESNVVISKCPCRGVGAKVHVEISSAIQLLQCCHVDVIL